MGYKGRLSAALILLCILASDGSAFSKIKPQLAAVQMSSDGFFTGVFTNGAGTGIRITGVGGRDMTAVGQCFGQTQFPRGVVQPGENFVIGLSGCYGGVPRQIGDVYNLGVRIDYEVNLGGVTSSHTDGGSVRGPIEGPTGKPTVRSSGGGGFRTDGFEERISPLFPRLPADADSLALQITILLAVAGLVVFGTGLVAEHRRQILYIAAGVFVFAIIGASYLTGPEPDIRMQQTIIVSQNSFVEGSQAALRVVALDAGSLAPLEGVPVTVRLGGEGGVQREVYSAATDSTGSAQVSFNLTAGEWPAGAYGLQVLAGEDAYEGEVSVVRKASAIMTTDKPLYQPGQEINMRVLAVSQFDGRPLAGEPVVFEVEDAKGNKIFKKPGATDAYGISSAKLRLADDIILGRYTIRAAFNASVREKTVEVRKYALPKFRAALRTDRGFYAPNDRVKAVVSSAYFFGKPVSDADVYVSAVTDQGRQVQTVKGKTNPEGLFSFEVAAPDGPQDYLLAFNASVVDSTGHVEAAYSAVPVSRDRIVIQAFPEAEAMAWGMENSVYLVTSYPDGSPAKTALTVNGQRLSTNALGVAAYKVSPLRPGAYALDISADDGAGNVQRAFKAVMVGDAGERMVLRTDKSSYLSGESAHIQCIYSGPAPAASAYIDVIRGGQTILAKSASFSGNSAEAEIPIGPEMAGIVRISCYKAASASDIVGDARTVLVGGGRGLDVAVSGDRAEYKPGEDARVMVRVTDAGAGVQSAVELKLVDEAVFALERQGPAPGGISVPGQPPDMPYGLSEAAGMGDEDALKAYLAAINSTGPDYGVRADSLAGKAGILRGYREQYRDYFSKLGSSLVGYMVTLALAAMVVSVLVGLMRRGGGGLLILIVLFILMFGIVWWQLGIFNIGSASTTSAGGVDQSIATKGSAPAEAEAAASGQGGKKPYLRQFFPETLHYDPEVITDPEGYAEVGVRMADSITTWRASALASSLDGRLGSNSSGVRVFQDFFIDLDLPRTLTQGDEVSVPVAIYNYLDKGQRISLRLEPADWYALLDEANKTFELGPREVSVAHFTVKAKRHGTHKMTVYAYGDALGDALSKDVEVRPYGFEEESVYSGVLNGDVSVDVGIPPVAVDGTGKIQVKFYPGYFSQVVDGLDGMLKMPYGCFEQTTSITYPNVLILKYLKSSGTATPQLRQKAEGYIGTGYQRLLTFETSTPGGFDWYGSPPPKLLLTAYGLMEFKDMSEVYGVDPALIARTQRWLASQQGGDGSWEPVQSLHFSQNMADSKLTSTCFVLWSLAHSGYAGREIGGAKGYIRDNMRPGQDPYTLAVCANALLESDKADAAGMRALDALDGMKTASGNATYWRSPGQYGGYESWSGGRGSTKDVETTAMAALAYMRAGYKPQTASQATEYLIQAKNSQGTWGSTQATIMSMKALISAAESLRQLQGAMTAKVFVNGGEEASLSFDDANRDVVRFVDVEGPDIIEGDNTVALTREGAGNIRYQIIGKYYSTWDLRPGNGSLRLDVRYGRPQARVGDVVDVTATLTYGDKGRMKMVMAELGIPPGFALQAQDLERLVEAGTINRYETSPGKATLYIPELAEKAPLTLTYRLVAQYPVRVSTPESTVYEYYNPMNRGVAAPQELAVTG
jgi:hypothetical protein